MEPEVDDPIYLLSESSDDGEENENLDEQTIKKKSSSIYFVKKVLKHKEIAGEIVYKVKWEGYKKCTWKPLRNFDDFTPVQEHFLRELESKK